MNAITYNRFSTNKLSNTILTCQSYVTKTKEPQSNTWMVFGFCIHQSL